MKLTPVKYATSHEDFFIELRNSEKNHWAVIRHGLVLNKDLQMEYEPLPSSRDEEFFQRCRFNSPEEASEYLQKFLEVETARIEAKLAQLKEQNK